MPLEKVFGSEAEKERLHGCYPISHMTYLVVEADDVSDRCTTGGMTSYAFML